ncbi:MAG: hypothetical protein ICV79_01105 [Flavisolibacter sp.]|nr:hypothetical protein [Flavisolibacter sp.]
MNRMLLALIALVCCFSLKAQLFTWAPPFPIENNSAQVLAITADATKRNKGRTKDANYIMNRTPDGQKFWIRLEGLTAGAEYAFQYDTDDALHIANPYVEKVLDSYNNNDQNISSVTYPNLKPYPSGKTTGIVGIIQTASPTYNWAVNNFNQPDKRGLVIYELLVRDFVAAHDRKTLKDTLNCSTLSITLE